MFLPPAVQPIAHLLNDPEISEIMINGVSSIFVEKDGRMRQVELVFRSKSELEAMVEGLIGPTGRAVTAMSPFVDFRLADGSRVNVVIPPIAIHGPNVTIRKFTKTHTKLDDLVACGTLSQQMGRFLRAAVDARLNVVFSGGAGSGKTTLLGLMAQGIGDDERIVVVEDTAELDFQQEHVVRLECRPPNIEGSGAVDQGQLLRNSLRMRPHRIIVGEVRGDEAIEMLQAMSSGHDGCLAVLHASSPTHAVSRLEMMVLSRGLSLPLWGIQRQISSSVDVLVQLEQLRDGTRKVTHVTEVGAANEDGVELRDLYRYVVDGLDAEGRPVGAFHTTGVVPSFLAKLERAGVAGTEALFQAS